MSDIERTYGGAQKPLVARTPLQWAEEDRVDSNEDDLTTPAVTDGESLFLSWAVTKASADTENEAELPELPDIATTRKHRSASSASAIGLAGDKAMTMHDLTNRYFRKPAVTLWRLDVFR
jgi:phosphatidylethanolamine N-methyltransferase